MAWYEVETNYRTFAIEAAGIGDAIDKALNLILLHEQGEFLRGVVPMIVMQVAA